jgi:hypothetical protein
MFSKNIFLPKFFEVGDIYFDGFSAVEDTLYVLDK